MSAINRLILSIVLVLSLCWPAVADPLSVNPQDGSPESNKVVVEESQQDVVPSTAPEEEEETESKVVTDSSIPPAPEASIRSVSDTASILWESTGISGFCKDDGYKNLIMIGVSLLLIYLAIVKGYEPLLLLPIGIGGLLSNIPNGGISEPGGFLYVIYKAGIETGLFPLLIFMGVGAMTDFGPLIANPKLAILGGAAQFGIFFALLGALFLSEYIPGINFGLKEAASIGIIGGADGPTAIFLTSRLAPDLLGSIAVAAYSYMALVPIIQPPIMRALTTESERNIVMHQMRPVSKEEKIVFPIMVILLCAFLLPSAAPLIGSLMFGNIARECGVVNRLSDTMQNAMCNIVTIMLGTTVGSKLSADKFLTPDTLGILFLGLIAFCVGTASGVLIGKLMNAINKKDPINPLIGAAGVSAVPMAARVVNGVGLETNPRNFLLMHAMGPNVSGVIGSAVVAGLLMAMLQ
ncbi:sodium ion-translocating decarboxylase subunit beta [bacterium]|nr:sodium ion-translocating decarboxylase subunit beta [bacterium]